MYSPNGLDKFLNTQGSKKPGNAGRFQRAKAFSFPHLKGMLRITEIAITFYGQILPATSVFCIYGNPEPDRSGSPREARIFSQPGTGSLIFLSRWKNGLYEGLTIFLIPYPFLKNFRIRFLGSRVGGKDVEEQGRNDA